MSVTAVFIDGVGKTREMALPDERHSYWFPLYKPLSASVAPSLPIDYDDAEFVRLGKLRDGRVVYGQAKAHLNIWKLDVVITDEMQRLSRVDVSEIELQRWMERCGRPCLCLLRENRHIDDDALTRWHFEGVGRNLEQQAGE